MLPRGMMKLRTTPKNGREGVSLDKGICSFWKATRLMRLRAAPPSIRTWYNLMVGEMTSGSCPAPTMFLGQSKAMKPMDVFIHLWWGASLGASAAAATATAQRSVLTTCLDIMSQEPPYMMQSCLWCSSVLESESEWL
jgi:hypothetical protein